MSTTKEQVLAALRNAPGALSGERIAAELGVSRMAVCKAVAALRAQGYAIESVPRRGYTLSRESETLSATALRTRLAADHPVTVLDTVDSTNTYLRARADAPDGTLVCAHTQTAGRGRRGKSFCSPAGAGVYFSFVLRRPLPLDQMWAVTFIAALAVTDTLRAAGVDAGIKWVNDVWANGKKLCGILTEADLDAEARESTRLIVGIGVNLLPGAFPPELAHIATSVADEGGEVSAADTVAGIVNRFDALFARFDVDEIVTEYRKRCILHGKTVTFERDGVTHTGVAAEILDNGNLAVDCPDGRIVLSSGEVSVKFSK